MMDAGNFSVGAPQVNANIIASYDYLPEHTVYLWVRVRLSDLLRLGVHLSHHAFFAQQ